MHRQFTLVSSRLRKKAHVPMRKETHWMQQLCAGETTAWAQLLDYWNPRLYSYVIYNGATQAETERLIQTILSEVVQAIVGSPPVANLTVLIFSIAYQQILRYRAQTLDPALKQLPPALQLTDPEADPWAGFFHVFYQFPAEVQQILLLHYLFEVPMHEISQIVSQPEATLTKILRRAKVHLQ
jgi:DNA-directed RNA polymerase specialized sigma24 family protein